jgi:hypothetical protein
VSRKLDVTEDDPPPEGQFRVGMDADAGYVWPPAPEGLAGSDPTSVFSGEYPID